MIEFGKSFQDIYPAELELTKESIFALEASGSEMLCLPELHVKTFKKNFNKNAEKGQ